MATSLCSYEEKSIKIEIYGGCNEIGGNSVVILDRGSDRKIVFDNGILSAQQSYGQSGLYRLKRSLKMLMLCI